MAKGSETKNEPEFEYVVDEFEAEKIKRCLNFLMEGQGEVVKAVQAAHADLMPSKRRAYVEEGGWKSIIDTTLKGLAFGAATAVGHAIVKRYTSPRDVSRDNMTS